MVATTGEPLRRFGRWWRGTLLNVLRLARGFCEHMAFATEAAQT